MTEKLAIEFKKCRISEMVSNSVPSEIEQLCSILDGNDTQCFEQKLVQEKLTRLITQRQHELNRQKKLLSRIRREYLNQTSTPTQ
jgi:predicted alpha/beta-fold hydrolase